MAYDPDLAKRYIDLYRTYHNDEKSMYEGFSATHNRHNIKYCMDKHKPTTMLDYGCGKASNLSRKDNCLEYWNIKRASLYDPAVPKFSKLSSGKFDCVLCTDVLEHIPEQNVPHVIEELTSRATMFAFMSISELPAKRTLPNGENAHCTCKPKTWWMEQLVTYGNPDIELYATFTGPRRLYNVRTKEIVYQGGAGKPFQKFDEMVGIPE